MDACCVDGGTQGRAYIALESMESVETGDTVGVVAPAKESFACFLRLPGPFSTGERHVISMRLNSCLRR